MRSELRTCGLLPLTRIPHLNPVVNCMWEVACIASLALGKGISGTGCVPYFAVVLESLTRFQGKKMTRKDSHYIISFHSVSLSLRLYSLNRRWILDYCYYSTRLIMFSNTHPVNCCMVMSRYLCLSLGIFCSRLMLFVTAIIVWSTLLTLWLQQTIRFTWRRLTLIDIELLEYLGMTMTVTIASDIPTSQPDCFVPNDLHIDDYNVQITHSRHAMTLLYFPKTKNNTPDFQTSFQQTHQISFPTGL